MAAYKILIDAMGGDYAPQGPVDGALLACERHPELSVVLAGRQDQIEKALEGKQYDSSRVTILHKEQVVENEEHNPAEAVRSKRDSSMMYGMMMVKNHEVDGMVSAGNTGAVLAGATLLVGRIPGVSRPALSVGLPGRKGPVFLLDVGANMDSKPAYLLQFAQMMTVYCRKQLGMDQPRVGLLNVGTEPGKGNALTKEVYELLQKEPEVNFVGNVEAREVLENAADIVVTDGFAGNILLKGLEGVARYMMTCLKEEVMSSTRNKIGGMLLKPAMKSLKGKLDPSAVGGTPLLGINGAVIKAHGNSKGEAFANAIEQCIRYLDSNVNEEIQECLARSKKRMQEAKNAE